MIDVFSEELLPIAKSGVAFPGSNPSQATIQRFRLKGINGIKLESVKVGGLRYTSREAISRFIAAQNAEDAPTETI